MKPMKPVQPTTETLLQQVREQKPGAWEQLLLHYQPRLEAWAARRIGSSGPGGLRRSDVCQEAALRAFQNFSSFRGSGEGQFNEWLERVFESCWADMARYVTRQKRDDGETLPLEADEVQDLPALQHTPSQVSAQQERGRLLLGYFLALPKDQREALSLYLLLGSSREELQARAGRSRDALDSLLRRGLRTLEAHMEGRAEAQPQGPRENLIRNRVDAALSLYFRRLEAGVPVDPRSFAEGYPDCADELRGLLQWLEELRPPASSPT